MLQPLAGAFLFCKDCILSVRFQTRGGGDGLAKHLGVQHKLPAHWHCQESTANGSKSGSLALVRADWQRQESAEQGMKSGSLALVRADWQRQESTEQGSKSGSLALLGEGGVRAATLNTYKPDNNGNITRLYERFYSIGDSFSAHS